MKPRSPAAARRCWLPEATLAIVEEMKGVHLAAYFGLGEAMIALLENGHELESKGQYWSYAAVMGCNERARGGGEAAAGEGR